MFTPQITTEKTNSITVCFFAMHLHVIENPGYRLFHLSLFHHSLSDLSSNISYVSAERKKVLWLLRFVAQKLYREVQFIHNQEELDAYDKDEMIGCYYMTVMGVPMSNMMYCTKVHQLPAMHQHQCNQESDPCHLLCKSNTRL